MKTSVCSKGIALLMIGILGLSSVLFLPSSDGTEEVLRLHIRAADDSAEEQELKLQVRNAVLALISPRTESCRNKQEAIRTVSDLLPVITRTALRVIREHGFSHPVTARIDRERFDYREYDGFYLPEGIYDALIIDIGPGAGHNWWCVLFPAVCYAGAAEQIETRAERMPSRFRLANRKNPDVQTEWWIVKQWKRWFCR